MQNKKRLDHRLLELYPHYSRQQLQSWIMQGKVLVNDHPINKPGMQVKDSDEIIITIQEPQYVSRAGLKLEHALKHFGVDVTGMTVLDAGLSTGGFTDCLLQRGAKKVYGVDVGYGQVHEKIRTDPRVVVMEKTNLRTLTDVGELVDLVTLDLSFISLLKVIEAVKKMLKPNGKLVVLIKPQFEAQKHQVGKGGIITDPVLHQSLVDQVVRGIQDQGFVLQGVTESPITGTEGNKEFLAFFYNESVV